MMERMVKGNAKREEIDQMLDVASRIEGHTICALGDAAAWPVQGLVRHFRGEIERRIDEFTEERRPDMPKKRLMMVGRR